VSLVLSILYYGNTTLTGIPGYPLQCAVRAQRCSKDHVWPAAFGAQQHNACPSSLASCRQTHHVSTNVFKTRLLATFFRFHPRCLCAVSSSTKVSLFVHRDLSSSFPFSGANLWNGLLDQLTSLQSQLAFWVNVKRFYFAHLILTSAAPLQHQSVVDLEWSLNAVPVNVAKM